jgi:outer membrane receptor for ferrienterochelin and colicins
MSIHRQITGLAFACCWVSLAQNQSKPSSISDADLLSSDLESIAQMKVVTASKFSQDMAKAPGVMTVINRDELERLNASTLYELLSSVVGFTFSGSPVIDRSLLAVRGDQTLVTGGHILFLINGRPTREVQQGGIITDLLEAFPVHTLERVEVIRGPGSVLYGSGAVAAVINLITKPVDASGINARTTGGTGGVAGGSLEAGARVGRLTAFFGGQFLENSGWHPTINWTSGPPLIDDVSERRQSLLADVNYRGFHFEAAYLESHTPFPTSLAGGRVAMTRAFGDLGYSFHVAGSWDSSVNLTYTRTTLDASNFVSLERDSREAQLEWTNSMSVTARDKLVFGMLVRETKGWEALEQAGLRTPSANGSQASGATYFQWEHDFAGAVELIGGVQANKIAELHWNLSPRIGAVWTPTPNLAVKALYSTAFRAPSLDESNTSSFLVMGDPKLRPERVVTEDAGFFYQSRRGLAGVNYFHTRLRDGIVLDFTDMPWQYRNAGRIQYHGVELETKVYLSRRWLLHGSLQYQSSAQANNATMVSPAPAWSPKAGISYRQPNGMSFSVFDHYSGSIAQYTHAINPLPVAFHMITADFRVPLWRRDVKPWGFGPPVFNLHAYNLSNHTIWLPDSGGSETLPFERGRVVSAGFEFAVSGSRKR